MSHPNRTRTYVERKLAEGKTKKEILRCLKRAIAREVYTALTCAQAAPVVEVDGNDLARERKARGITMVTAAEALGTYPARISDIEKNKRPLIALTDQYRNWLTAA